MMMMMLSYHTEGLVMLSVNIEKLI